MGFLAFQLTEEFAGYQDDGETPIYGGGQVAKTDGTTFDVGAELEEGNGVIVIDDQDSVAEQLRALPCLESCDVPDDVEDDEAESAEFDLEKLSVEDLRVQAEARNLTKSGNRGELLERIREHDAESAEASSTDSTEGEAS